eukprot:CAMPEP_0183430536 /NCGR_PEP_ID=MMETSP0370-20130417/51797_1 /TAXON_ID=268820 /ORGANISM="Peridinium aciculiferum, Strain PAER-2" /LENGTH=73 /DNA_ID=CAMNT_0025615913 /DNA_START=14 /DNA_END=232 /DNA_ORIENTATION=+
MVKIRQATIEVAIAPLRSGTRPSRSAVGGARHEGRRRGWGIRQIRGADECGWHANGGAMRHAPDRRRRACSGN